MLDLLVTMQPDFRTDSKKRLWPQIWKMITRCSNIPLKVAMWVFEEEVNGRKLTEIINTEHENVKYLPGRALPENVVAIPDISVAAQDADFLIFVLPHQFIGRACAPLKGKLKPSAQGLSLVKGFAIQPGDGFLL